MEFSRDVAIFARKQGEQAGGDSLGNHLRAHGGRLGLGAGGGDGGVEKEGHVEHLALQQQPCSLLHLLRGK